MTQAEHPDERQPPDWTCHMCGRSMPHARHYEHMDILDHVLAHANGTWEAALTASEGGAPDA